HRRLLPFPHDALPISLRVRKWLCVRLSGNVHTSVTLSTHGGARRGTRVTGTPSSRVRIRRASTECVIMWRCVPTGARPWRSSERTEEHTSELQSRENL